MSTHQYCFEPQSVLLFLWQFIKPKWLNIAVIMLCPLIWAVSVSFSPYVLKLVIDVVVNYEGDRQDVWVVALSPVLLFIVFQLSHTICLLIEEYVMLKTIPVIKAEIRASMFDYVQKHSHSYFQDHLSGTLSNKVLDMVRAFENMFLCVVTVFFPITVMCLLSTAILFTVHWWFALFVFVWFTAYILVIALCSGKCIAVSDAHSTVNSTLSGKIVDAFRNISTVRLFSRRLFENTYLDGVQKEEVSRAQRLGVQLLKTHLFQSIASLALFAVALILFIYAWQKNVVTVGDFTFVMTTALSLLIMTWWMAEQLIIFFKELGVSRQALSMISVAHEITDAPDAKPLEVLGGEIAFQKVNFHYVRGKNIFNDKSLTIPAGTRVGLVGFSGSGKTTFINLILRCFDIESGAILIDGQNIRDVTQESLRAHIAVIPQDTMLFHRSLMDNIRYGRLDASDDEVIEASKKACCHDFIVEIEEGYAAIVGEGGIKLSGGQRQRVAVARAILKDAPILILDEATSALDSVTERQIQKSLNRAMEGRTTIVIAHRLSTLSMLDRILVFDEGVIVESGTHGDLLQRGGHYAELWRMQTGGFLPDKA